MHTHAILDLMEYWRHCHECGALLVTVPGGAICPHCGFSEPVEAAVLAFRRASGSGDGDRFWAADDRPEDVFDEVA